MLLCIQPSQASLQKPVTEEGSPPKQAEHAHAHQALVLLEGLLWKEAGREKQQGSKLARLKQDQKDGPEQNMRWLKRS